MVKSISREELYNSQTTDYLLKKQIELSQETSTECRDVARVISNILESREIWEEFNLKEDERPCGWVCDYSCWVFCKNKI